MGIHFACHVCSKKLNIKQELAGRRGICPACSAKFRIPLHDAEKSTPVDSPAEPRARRPSNGHAPTDPSVREDVVAAAQTHGGGQMIDLIDDDPTSTWYVRPPGGGQYGPATAGSDTSFVSGNRASAREVEEFGFADSAHAAETTVTSAADRATGFAGRAEAGSDRRTRSDRRTLTIVALTGVAICLVFALAFILSR